MSSNYEHKMAYMREHIMPMLEEAFKRGDVKYHGIQHSHHSRIFERSSVEDIYHIMRCHVNVRMGEAEGAADDEEFELALRKIESAIGYLIILHNRINIKHFDMGAPE